jgi:hypothetical protein
MFVCATARSLWDSYKGLTLSASNLYVAGTYFSYGRSGERSMLDALFIAAACALFAVTVGYTYLVERL